jgi:hypothetical protein
VVPHQDLHDLVFNFETDDVLGPITRSHAGYLHDHGEARVTPAIRVMHAVNMGHTARVDALFNDKPIQFCPGP